MQLKFQEKYPQDIWKHNFWFVLFNPSFAKEKTPCILKRHQWRTMSDRVISNTNEPCLRRLLKVLKILLYLSNNFWHVSLKRFLALLFLGPNSHLFVRSSLKSVRQMFWVGSLQLTIYCETIILSRYIIANYLLTNNIKL